MSPTAHAVLGASSSHRWFNCPGSIRASEGMPNTSSVFAREGTAAHALAEHCLSHGFDTGRFLDWGIADDGKLIERPNDTSDLVMVDEEMVEAVQVYLDTVRADYKPGDVLVVEQRFDLSSWYPGCFGTNDAGLYRPSTGLLRVYDLKYGRGVPVEVERNSQLLYYGLGAAMAETGRLINTVELVVVQPRAPHRDGPVRRWETTGMELLDWAVELVEAAKRTTRPDAPLNPGEWCKFCPAAPTCPALRQKALDVAKAEFTEGGALTLPDVNTLPLSEVLHQVGMIEDWCRRVRDFAHHEAEAGRTPEGWKLVGKRPSRKFRDETTAIETLRLVHEVEDEHLYDPPKFKSPAKIEATLRQHYGLKGKKATEAIADLVTSVSSGTVLAPIDDPRPPATPEAATEFSAVNVET